MQFQLEIPHCVLCSSDLQKKVAIAYNAKIHLPVFSNNRPCVEPVSEYPQE